MKLKHAIVVVCLVTCGLISLGRAQNYGPAVNYVTGSFPAGIAAGDFNRDSSLDIVVANDNSSSLSLFLGKGDGTFNPAITIPVGPIPVAVAAADFNGDGNLDVAVSLLNAGGFQILFGNGDGTFQSPIFVPAPSAILGQIAAADLNGDGHPDLVVSEGFAGLQVFLNDGSGGFNPGATILGFNITNFAIADFNQDGHPDIAWIGIGISDCGVSGRAFLSFGNGDGTFQPAVVLPTASLMPGGIAAADFNHDGRMDIVVSEAASQLCQGPTAVTNQIEVALQQPDGSFAVTSTITSIVNPGHVITGDFDGDGNLDIAVLQSSFNSAVSPPPPDALMIYRGDGSGGFSGPNQFNLPVGPFDLLSGGLTNTTALDIAVTNTNSDLLSVFVNQGANTLALSSSSNPAGIFAPVTLTATVQPKFPGSGTLSGSVIFADGSKTLGTASVNSSGVSTLATTFNTQGSHPLLAVFSGNSSFAGGSSASLTQIVNRALPAVTLVSSKNPSSFGELVEFTATVSPVGAGVNPTGTLSLAVGATVIATGTLDNTGKIVLDVSSLPVGANSIIAQYAGDANYTAANSSPVIQTVNKSSTTTALDLSPNPSVFGQGVTLTATVAASGGGSGVPSGTATFSDGNAVIGTAPLDGTGKAKLVVNTFAVGSHTLKASYPGDGNFLASTSPTGLQNVNKSPTTATLTDSPNPSVFGQQVTLSATVVAAGGGAGVPSGTVTFNDGANALGSGTLDSNGKVSLTVNSLSVGSHNVTANYSGDTNFLTSTSAAVAQAVNKSPTATTLTATPNPSVFGQNVTLSAIVAAAGGGAGVPSGTVTFSDGGTALGTASLNNTGKATLSVSSLAVGAHNLSAAYGGDGNFNPSSASGAGGVTQVVNQSTTTTVLSSSANPSVFGQAAVFAAVVTASGGGAGTPSGIVTFSDGATSLGSVTLDNAGKATLTVSSLVVGSHSIVASYAGNQSFLASNSSTLTQIVNKNGVVINLTSAPNPSSYGQSVTFSVQATAAPPGGSPGTPIPTGTITFSDGNTVLGTATLDNTGKASIAVGTLTAGSHTIVASYGGDANFSKGSSSPYLQEVSKAQTQASLTSSMNPTTNASTITLNAHLTSAAGSPSGSVTFLDGAEPLASVPLDGSGSATLPLSNLSDGSHALIASYSGDANFASSQSTPINEKVVDSHSAVALASSVNPQTVTQTVTFTARVTPALGGLATSGTITFSDGPIPLATVPLVNSAASFATDALAVGDHSITANYKAGVAPGPFDGISPPLIETINQASPILIIGGKKQDFTLSIQQSSSEIRAGETFTTQITLAPVNGLAGAVITFCGGVPEGATCTVAPDMATLDGKNPITATLAIATTAAAAPSASLRDTERPWNHRPEFLAVLLLPFAVCYVPLGRMRRHRLVILTLWAGLLAGCGGTTVVRKPLPANTPPGTYTITVQSQSGSLAHSGQIVLAVK